jgi:hypothetical protein
MHVEPELLNIVAGLVLLFGIGAAVNWLRKSAARKRADNDPSNDGIADIQESAADALEALPTATPMSRILGTIGRFFKRK